jgi:hypothetical protein
MSGRNNTAVGVNVNPTGARGGTARGTGTTVAGVVAGGDTLEFTGGCQPIPEPGWWVTGGRVVANDPTIRTNPR